jgi:hypothetical protein
MQAPRVIVVLLRQPSNAITERRDDPFWEVGSFGCTGCHSRNLMNPKWANELSGARLAFVQGGPLGFRLVHVTSEIWMEPLGDGFEARWSPRRMPLSYRSAPLVIDKSRQQRHSAARHGKSWGLSTDTGVTVRQCFPQSALTGVRRYRYRNHCLLSEAPKVGSRWENLCRGHGAPAVDHRGKPGKAVPSYTKMAPLIGANLILGRLPWDKTLHKA